MDYETLFTSSKWDILRVLSYGQKSPLELARETKTSIANISQQLRMLELAKIVKSERVGNRERGEPRLLYSLSGPNSFLISASPGFVQKKQFVLSPRNEITFRIWFIEDISSHYFLEKFIWDIEHKISKIEAILAKSSPTRVEVLIVSNDDGIKQEIKSREVKRPGGESKRVEVKVMAQGDFEKSPASSGGFTAIYDPNQITVRKGGKQEEER